MEAPVTPANGNAPRAQTVEKFHTIRYTCRPWRKKSPLSLTHFDDPESVHIVFSAHGLPLSLIERGDPYANKSRRP